MRLGFQVKGDKKIIKELKKWEKRFPDALAAALYQEGFNVDARAVQKTPVDTGLLRANHYVAPPTEYQGGTVVEVGFGTDYAIYVHERTELHHKVGEAKFLEKAVNEVSHGYAERLLKRTEKNARTGIGARSIPPQAPTRPKE